MEAQWKIERWVYEQARTSTGAFYSGAPVKELGIDQQVVFSKLLSMVSDGKLEIEFEIRCPDCFVTAFRGPRIQIPNEFYCDRCDVTYTTIEEDIIPYFRFTASYKNHVKSEEVKKPHRMIRAGLGDGLRRQRSLASSRL